MEYVEYAVTLVGLVFPHDRGRDVEEHSLVIHKCRNLLDWSSQVQRDSILVMHVIEHHAAAHPLLIEFPLP